MKVQLSPIADKGPVIGFYKGEPTHKTITDAIGIRGRYVGILPPDPNGNLKLSDFLRPDEFLVYPGLVYRIVSASDRFQK